MKLSSEEIENDIVKLDSDDLLSLIESKIDRKKLENSLYYFTRSAWHIVEPSVDMLCNWTIGAVCEHLEACVHGDIRNLVINIPPRMMKSLITNVFFPAWIWTIEPHEQFIFSSYAESLAIRDSIKCRMLIKSEWYQKRWPGVQVKRDQDTKKEFVLTAGGHRVVKSVGGSATGLGGNYLICDDGNDAKHSRSKKKLEDVSFWWDKVMSTRLNNAKTGRKIIIQQRIAELDLTGHVLKQGGYAHLSIPMKYEENTDNTSCIGWIDPRKEEGELAWPERFGEEELIELEKRLGADGTAGQLQQRPSPAGGAIFKKIWFNYYKEEPRNFHHKMLSIDCSFKNTETSDFVAMQVWGIVGSNKYLLWRVKKKLDFPETLVEIASIHLRFSDLRYTLVEDAANGSAVISTFKKKIRGLIAFNPKGDSKEGRASSVAPQVEAGDVWLPDPYYEKNRDKMPWVAEGLSEFLEEVTSFPKGANDDEVDSLVQMLIKEEQVSGWLSELIEDNPVEKALENVPEELISVMKWDKGDIATESEEYVAMMNGDYDV